MSEIYARRSTRPAPALGSWNSLVPAGEGSALALAASQRRSLRASPDAPAAARQEIDDLAVGVEDDVVDRSRLLATELVTNCLRHAGLGPDQGIDLDVSVVADRVTIAVADEGGGFDLPREQPDPGPESGWGLWLVDRLADRWGLDPGPGTRVWCEFDRPGGQARSSAVSTPDRIPASADAVASFMVRVEQAAASYGRAQRRALRGASERDAHPLEFDESGFPIRQPKQGFVARVARLLRP